MHIAWIQVDDASLRRGGTARTAICTCGWRGPQRGTLELVTDDAKEHERLNKSSPLWRGLQAMSSALTAPQAEHPDVQAACTWIRTLEPSFDGITSLAWRRGTPPSGVHCLVGLNQTPEIFVARHDGEHWYSDGVRLRGVIAWMPIPDPSVP